jgi:hypothetical protein
MNTPSLHNAFLQETEAAGAGGGVGGIYKDRYRWLAVLHVPVQGHQGRHYLLGRYESEDEANAAYKWVSVLFHLFSFCQGPDLSPCKCFQCQWLYEGPLL